MVIGTDCTGSCKSCCIMTTTAPTICLEFSADYAYLCNWCIVSATKHRNQKRLACIKQNGEGITRIILQQNISKWIKLYLGQRGRGQLLSFEISNFYPTCLKVAQAKAVGRTTDLRLTITDVHPLRSWFGLVYGI